MRYKVITQRYENGFVIDNKPSFITDDKQLAEKVVKNIREYQGNQLCYYKETI